jgi:hypothetical protein
VLCVCDTIDDIVDVDDELLRRELGRSAIPMIAMSSLK